MTKNFDLFCEAIINEYITSKSKRHNSRYWKPTAYPQTMQVRKVSNKGNVSASQATKQGNRQYVGSIASPDGIRQNKSEKDVQQIGISKGLGGHLRINQHTRPKKVGAAINSKQGDMIVKQVLANGTMNVGSIGKRDYSEYATKRDALEAYRKKFGN